MLYRLVIVLACVVCFINSCNSLISGLTGTHKLRQFSMETLESAGIGDSDFVTITGAYRTGDFLITPPTKNNPKAALQYPVVSAKSLENLKIKGKTPVKLIVWTEDFDLRCANSHNCIQQGAFDLKGVVYQLPKNRNRIKDFDANKYQFAENIIYIQTERAPIAWYWHLVIMVGAVGLALVTEFWYNRKAKRLKTNTENNQS